MAGGGFLSLEELKMKIPIVILTILLLSSPGWADNKTIVPADIQMALDNLKDDNFKMNCVEAAKYLYERREDIMDILSSSLPTLDWQGQNVVLKILTETKSFKPDKEFIKLMLEQINDGGRAEITNSHDMWDYDYILYLEDYTDEFKDLFKSYIKSDNIKQLWVVTRLFSKSNLLNEMKNRYTPEVMNFVVTNLRNDDIPNNAAYASRICFMLGKGSVPYLEKETQLGDSQSKQIAKIVLRLIAEETHDSWQLWNDNDWEYVDDLRPFGITMDSTYLNRIERYGNTYLERISQENKEWWDPISLSDSYLIKASPEDPKFLVGKEYEQRSSD
jgi:hypothetical protein